MEALFNSKRVAVTLLGMLVGISSMFAQKLQEVVYLKNGSIIYGTIIEQVPNESLKIKTADGNVFFYKMDEIAKITKEVQEKRAVENDDEEENNNTYGWNQAPRYRGFIGDSYIFGVGDIEKSREFLYTSHGCQITPFLYAGVGVGVNYWFDDEKWSIPVFGHLRSELHSVFKKNFSPYVDTKIGYSFADCKGFYFTPSIGCHFYFGHSKTGLSVGVGYVLQKADVYEPFKRSSSSKNVGGVEVTLAFDF